MRSVSVSRTFNAQPTDLEATMGDLEPFMQSAGFDDVAVDDTEIRVTNQVGPVEISLVLEVVDDPEAALAYVQQEGIFEEMTTRYTLEQDGEGTTVTATTSFSLDVAVVGDFLDATVIKRQRTRELTAQLNFLEDATTD